MSNWFRRFTAILLLCTVAVTSACLDYESGVTLNKDLSGKASFKMLIDLEPFVAQMVQAVGSRGGGPPMDDFATMMKAEMAKQFGSGMLDLAKMKSALPAGVTLIDSSDKVDGLKLTSVVTFGFTDMTKLPLIEVPMRTESLGAGAAEESIKPFEYVITDDGTTISISSKEPAPGEKAGEEKELADAMKTIKATGSKLEAAGLGEMFKGMKFRFALRFEIPQTVIEHNATRKEGQAYIWELKLDSLLSLDKTPSPPQIKLKFKK
jgi:hypothetical protein